MQESDTYLMILEEGEEKGQEKATREIILAQGEDRFGSPDEHIKDLLNAVTDVARLKRMARVTPKAATWMEILATP